MKTSCKGKSELLGRLQWKHLAKVSEKCKEECNEVIYQTYVRNVRKNAMKTSSKGKSEMLGRMQWRNLPKVCQKCWEECNEDI